MADGRRDGFASFLGVAVFLIGVGLIGATFWQAYDIFSKAPQLNLGIESGKPIDFNIVGLNFARLVVKVLLLVVMAGIGSALANRGVRMYASGGRMPHREASEDLVPPEPTEPG